jgi:hypothetical protein
MDLGDFSAGYPVFVETDIEHHFIQASFVIEEAPPAKSGLDAAIPDP